MDPDAAEVAREIAEEWGDDYVLDECEQAILEALTAARAEGVREERREFLLAVQRISLGFMEHLSGDSEVSDVVAAANGVCDALERWVRSRAEEPRDE